MPLTGERTVPGVPQENYWFRRHEAAYEFVAPLVAGRVALDVGCGEGYGPALLARSARRILGIDYDKLATAHAAHNHSQAYFVRANLAALPVPSASVDVVVTLQVIEHVWNHGEFVRECRRVLRPGGLLVVTTPNRLTFSPGLDEPANPFHTREFSAAELVHLLAVNGFDVQAASGLHGGPRVRELDRRYGSFVEAQLSSPPDEWPAALRDDVASITTADFGVLAADRGDIDESLDLVILVRRQ